MTEITIDTPLDRIEKSIRDDWVQGSFGDWQLPEGPVCLDGAIMREAEVNRVPIGLTQRIRYVMEELLQDEGWGDVTEFNDAQDTTKDDILAFIEKVRVEFKRRSLEVFHV